VLADIVAVYERIQIYGHPPDEWRLDELIEDAWVGLADTRVQSWHHD
jgi:hypothetical protein